MTSRKDYHRQYGIERYQVYKRLGVCAQCRKRDARPGMTTCRECRDGVLSKSDSILQAQRRRYHRRKDKGQCVRCKAPALGGYSVCEKCRAVQAEYKRAAKKRRAA